MTGQVKGSLRKALQSRFETFAKSGDSLSSTPRTLALSAVASLRGISQLACGGASRAELMKVAELAAQGCVGQE